jgi:hypothetical protein
MQRWLMHRVGALAVVALLQAATNLSGQALDGPGGGDAQQAAEASKRTPSGPTPRLSDGKPDFSGIWGSDIHFTYDLSEALKEGERLPLQPWAVKVARERMSKDDPEANCLPTGVPRLAPYPWNIVQTAQYVYFLFEGNIHSYRQIFMDGRKHSADPNPTWYGESIGKYDGDTLVVDTLGFNDKFWFDFAGHPHTEKLHIVERYRRPDLGHLEWETAIDDPGAYTKPFTLYGHTTLQTGTDLIEYICQENNRDVEHITGKDSRNTLSK